MLPCSSVDSVSGMRSVGREPGRRDERERGNAETARRTLYRRFNLGELVRLMRQGDYLALREFARRYRPMLRRYCDQAGLDVRDFVSLAADVLGDVALQLIESRGAVPETVDNLLITMFKNRFIDEERKEGRRAARAQTAGADGEEMDGVSRAVSSEASVRAASGPLWEAVPLARGVERLASMLDEGLTEEERMLLSWVSAHRPQTQIAEWLGLSYSAARKRLERLRARLSDLAKQYQHSLSGRDRRDVDRFFARFDDMLQDRKLPPSDETRAAINE